VRHVHALSLSDASDVCAPVVLYHRPNKFAYVYVTEHTGTNDHFVQRIDSQLLIHLLRFLHYLDLLLHCISEMTTIIPVK